MWMDFWINLKCDYRGQLTINRNLLTRMYFKDYWRGAKDVNKILISDIPKQYKKNEFYKRFIVPRKYEEFPNYGIIKNKGIWSFNNKQLIYPSKNHTGYASATLYRIDGSQANRSIHIIMADAFLTDNPSCLPQVNHIDGNKMNFTIENNPELGYICNLERCTPKENIEHAMRTGLRDDSTKRYNGKKVSPIEVKLILILYSTKLISQRELSKIFDLTKIVVKSINDRKKIILRDWSSFSESKLEIIERLKELYSCEKISNEIYTKTLNMTALF